MVLLLCRCVTNTSCVGVCVLWITWRSTVQGNLKGFFSSDRPVKSGEIFVSGTRESHDPCYNVTGVRRWLFRHPWVEQVSVWVCVCCVTNCQLYWYIVLIQYVTSSWRLLCHHKSAIWYWFLPSMCFRCLVHGPFLENIMMFSRWPGKHYDVLKKMFSRWNCLQVLTTSGYVWLTTWHECVLEAGHDNSERCLPDWSCRWR